MIKIYSRSWKFIKESRQHIIIISLLFLASIILGYLFPIFFNDFIKQIVEQIAKQTEGMNFFQLFIFILQNNAQTAFMGLIFGLLIGILPVFFVLFNGYVLGFVMNKAVLANGGLVLWRLMPHGIFELPALILSLGLGLRIGMFAFKKPGQKKKELVYSLTNSLKVFLCIIIPLLIIAATIEAALIVLLK